MNGYHKSTDALNWRTLVDGVDILETGLYLGSVLEPRKVRSVTINVAEL
ncbi:TPA: hypothetical protein ACPHT2_000003 [Vibrio antiquarius]